MAREFIPAQHTNDRGLLHKSLLYGMELNNVKDEYNKHGKEPVYECDSEFYYCMSAAHYFRRFNLKLS